jgi:hypothetical protein
VGPPVVEDEDDPTKDEEDQITTASEVANNNRQLQKTRTIAPGKGVLPVAWQTSDPANDEQS